MENDTNYGREQMNRITGKSDNLEFGSAIVFALSSLANVLGAIFQIVAGRILNSTILYADLNVLSSLYTILMLPATMIGMVIAKYVADFERMGQYGHIKTFTKIIMKPIMLIAVTYIMMGWLLQDVVSDYLFLEDKYLVFLVFVLAAISILAVISTGSLQGMKLFLLYGVIGLIGPITKLIAIFAALFVTKKLLAVFIVWIVGILLAFVIGLIIVDRNLKGHKGDKLEMNWKLVCQYGSFALLINLGLSLISNLDILFIKHFFTAEAGLYSTALILGKTVTYFGGAIVVVLFPLTVGAQDDDNYAQKLLTKSLIYNAVLCIMVIAFLNFFGDFIVCFMYGSTYLNSTQYLFPISIMVFPMSMITLIVNYALARNKEQSLIYILLCGVAIEIIAASLWHESIVQMIWMLAGIMWVLFLMSLAYILYNKKCN